MRLEREQRNEDAVVYYRRLTVDETAALLETSPVTVRRDWRGARICLNRELTGGSVAPPERSAE